MSFKILAVSIALLATVATTGCAKNIAEKTIEKTIEKQTGGKVNIDTGKNKLPADFPKDVPVYKPSKVEGSIGSTNDGQKSTVVTLTTADGVDEVADFYKAELPGKGWTETSNMSGGDGASKFATLGYEKGEVSLSVALTTRGSDDKGGTQLFLGVSPKVR